MNCSLDKSKNHWYFLVRNRISYGIDINDNLKDLSFGNNKILTISESNDIGIVSNSGLVKITSLRNKRINQLTFKDDFFYILGNGGLIMRSKNGLKWTEIVTNTNNDLLRLKWIK